MATTKFQRIIIQPMKLRIHIWLFERKDLKTEKIINCSGIHGVLCAVEFMDYKHY
ncbi:unnamed protein product [Brassica rapa subsp. trilocularis]